MPRHRTADQKDPETYPEQARMDSVEAVAFIPRTGQYLLLGACHVALLWARNGSLSQKDVMTVELIVGDIQATIKSANMVDTQPASPTPVPAQSNIEARIGPWMLLCALALVACVLVFSCMSSIALATSVEVIRL